MNTGRKLTCIWEAPNMLLVTWFIPASGICFCMISAWPWNPNLSKKWSTRAWYKAVRAWFTGWTQKNGWILPLGKDTWQRHGFEFIRDFRDGRRKFDFFCPEAKLIIEVRKVKSLEKLAHPYAEYAQEKGYRMLLIPVRDMLLERALVFDKIAKLLADPSIPVFWGQACSEKYSRFCFQKR